MSIAPLNSTNTETPEASPVHDGDIERPVKRKKRRSTSHLKAVPETLALREKVRVQETRQQVTEQKKAADNAVNLL